MVLADVVPGTKLPLQRTQAFTYRLDQPAKPGQVVSVPLGRRLLRGVVVGPPAHQPGTAVTLKTAAPEPWQLPAAYLALARDVAATYRVSLGQVFKLMLPTAGSLAAEAPAALATAQAAGARLVLSGAQAEAAARIASALNKAAGFLLYGVTGSGKTEVYLEVIKKVLTCGGQVLLLVPEIAMTPQLAARLTEQLGDVVVTWHSGLTPAERRRRWVRLAAGQPTLLLGPRSAAFVPLPKLGLIIVDEAHDGSYKQSDQEPRVHAGTVVRMLSRHARCPLVFGTATPSVELWHAASVGSLELLQLPERYGGTALPTVEFVDVRGAPSSEPLSPATLSALDETLARGRQSIVLINRRGAARIVVCGGCGHVWQCRSCQRSLVLHHQPTPYLACHYCDQRQPQPSTCPDCGDARHVTRGVGTQTVEALLRAHFPRARIARLDRDVARSKQRMQSVTQRTLDGEVDILVGTQLVAKGWDIDRLDVVVVLDADQGLLEPDLRAHERTAQLLWQVAGRAGRRATRGRVLLETRQPDHPVLKAVASHSYQTYLEQELRERRRLLLPPFRRLIAITLEGASDTARRRAEDRARASITRLLREQPTLERAVQIWPARDIILPRGRVIRRFAVATTRVGSIVAALPLDAGLDVDPEEL